MAESFAQYSWKLHVMASFSSRLMPTGGTSWQGRDA